MYGTNKALGAPLTVQPDTTLTCLGGTTGGTNNCICTLAVTSNILSLSSNTSIIGTLGMAGLTSLHSKNVSAGFWTWDA